MFHEAKFRPHRRWLAVAGLALLALPACRSSMSLVSHWTTEPAEPRQPIPEWEKRLPIIKLDNNLIVGFCNDRENLYVLFSPDWHYDNRFPVESATVALTLEAASSPLKPAEFIYTHRASRTGPEGMARPEAGDRPGSAPQEGPPGGGSRPDRPMSPLPGDQGPAVIEIRRAGSVLNLPADGSRGPQVSVDESWGAYTYRWRIPLGSPDDPSRIALRPGDRVVVDLSWTPRQAERRGKRRSGSEPGGPEGEEGMPPPGGGMGGGMGGDMGGGGMRGGMGGPMGPGGEFAKDSRPAKRHFHASITLARPE